MLRAENTDSPECELGEIRRAPWHGGVPGEVSQIWLQIKESKDPAIFEAFRREYGSANSVYDALAAERITDLRRASLDLERQRFDLDRQRLEIENQRKEVERERRQLEGQRGAREQPVCEPAGASSSNSETIVSTRPIVGAVPTIPPSASASPICARRSYWSHNGSILYLEADQDKRFFHYLRPREGIAAENVKPGTLLFNGRRIGDRYEGTARNYSKNCGVRTYKVSGNVENNNRRVTLIGNATQIDHVTCLPQAMFLDTLVFEFAGCE